MFKAIVICSLLFAGALANFPNYQENLIDLNGWTIEPRIPIDISNAPYPYREQNIVKPIVYELPPPPPPAPVVYPKPTKPITEIIAVPAQKVGLITSLVSGALCAVKSVLSFIFTHLPALGLGVLGAIGVCKFTSLCQLSTIQALIEAKDKMFTTIAADKLTMATDFLNAAVNKYNAL